MFCLIVTYSQKKPKKTLKNRKSPEKISSRNLVLTSYWQGWGEFGFIYCLKR